MSYNAELDNDGMPLQNAAVSYASLTPAWLSAPTGSQSPLTLESGSVWANNKTGVTLNYNFWNALPTYYTGADEESNNFQAFSASMKSATVEVLTMISTFANITFVETTNQAITHLGYAQANIDPQAGAWAYYPNPNPKGGDVWTNNMYANTQNVTPGTYGFYVLLHETGHALGLEHTFTAGLTGAQNTEQYSVMAYDWTPWGGSTFAQSYQLYDIYALQDLYGANMTYHTGNDFYMLESGKAYTIWDAGGTDTMDASLVNASVTLRLEAGTFSSVGLTDNIAIAYNVAMENAAGSEYNDTIYGNALNNRIFANGGNDTIYTDAGDDDITGGAGNDTVVYATNIANFLITITNASILGLTVKDLVGSLGTDVLDSVENYIFGGISYTFSALQTLVGGGGSGGGGGGSGSTPVSVSPMLVTLVYSGGSTKVNSTTETSTTLTAAGMKYTGKSGNLITTDRHGDELSFNFLQNITLTSLTFNGGNASESLVLNGTSSVVAKITGGAGNDSVTIASGITGNDTISGGDGNDTVHSSAGNDTLKGDGGNDGLYGDAGDDKLYGGTGGDNLHGGIGADYLYGENDDDQLYGDDGADRLYGDAGNDTVDGGAGDDTIYGGTGDDTLNGGTGNDTLNGEAGNNTLNGGDGNDRLNGYTGIDTLNGGTGDDIIYGNSGADTINGDDGIDKLYGDAGNDTIHGGTGADLLYGYADNDILYGDDGADKIYGGTGNDKLIGGAGVDTLYGEGGSDTFGFTTLDGAVDTVLDFTRTGVSKDYLNISNILSGFDKGVDNLNDFVKFVVTSSTITISINADGAGSDWIALASVKGSTFTGSTVDNFLAAGQLITDQPL